MAKKQGPQVPEKEPHSFVFLDLEETVIDDWSNGEFLLQNIDVIEQFLNGRDQWFQNHTVLAPATPMVNMKLGLMSWAVWDQNDKEDFNVRIRPHLETLLKRKFDDHFLWTMDEWAAEVFKHFNKKVTREDLFDMFSKPEVLFALSRTHPDFKDNTIFLIDDKVEHLLTTRSPNNKCTVELRNINKMRM